MMRMDAFASVVIAVVGLLAAISVRAIPGVTAVHHSRLLQENICGPAAEACANSTICTNCFSLDPDETTCVSNPATFDCNVKEDLEEAFCCNLDEAGAACSENEEWQAFKQCNFDAQFCGAMGMVTSETSCLETLTPTSSPTPSPIALENEEAIEGTSDASRNTWAYTGVVGAALAAGLLVNI